jgi:hypothetical protein
VDYYRGLRAEIPESVPIIGGSAIGIITNTAVSYSDYSCGIAAIQSDSVKFTVVSVGDLDNSEYQAGLRLGEKISALPDAFLMLMFYDSIKQVPTATTPLIINASPLLIRGIEETISVPLPIVGAGVCGSYAFEATYQFCGFSVQQQSVVGALLSEAVHPYFSVMHGCTPKDGLYHTITKIEGSFVYEIDNKPIVNFITEAYGSDGWKKQHPVKFLTIGINYGDRYGRFREDNYVNRLIAGVLPDDSAIVLFEPDLEVGTEIQFMLRDGRKMVENARENTRSIMEQIIKEGKKPCFGLYIDCGGRSAEYSDTLTEEAAEVQKVFNEFQSPLLGFYSGVEIAPLLGKNRGLDWTGVLLVLAMD